MRRRCRQGGFVAVALPLFGHPAMADNPLCWQGAEAQGYTKESCCAPELDPVGHTACWWDGYEFEDSRVRGDYSYWKCCNNSVLERNRPMLDGMMDVANRMPYLVASRIVLYLENYGMMPSRYAINFGAADGSVGGDDPVVPLFVSHGYAGLAVEPDERKARLLRERMPEAVTVYKAGVTPGNVADLLEMVGAPPEPAFLKVDIDSFDCALLLATLRVSRPLLVQIEVNSEIPFPLIFGVHYSEDFRHSAASGREHGWFSRGFFGCSAGLAAEIAMPFGYDLIAQAGAHDLLLMRSDKRLALKGALPEPPLLSYTPGGVARAISVRSMKNYFGVGVGVSWLVVAERQPERLLELVRQGLETSCEASQGRNRAGDCRINYTLGYDADAFRSMY